MRAGTGLRAAALEKSRHEPGMSSMALNTVSAIVGEIARFIWSVVKMSWRLVKSSVRMVSSIDGMEMNKVMAAVLFAGLIGMTAGFLADLLVYREDVTEFAFAPDVGAGPAEITVEAEPEIDIAILLQTADPAAGEALTRACAACHTFDQGGADRVGPHMWGVVGRAKAGVEGFNYSSAMEAAGGSWTFENLNGFLQRPRDYLPGTSMSYAGMRDAEDRANMIAFLRTLDENPVPLPDPPAPEEAAVETDTGEAGAAPAEDAAGAGDLESVGPAELNDAAPVEDGTTETP